LLDYILFFSIITSVGATSALVLGSTTPTTSTATSLPPSTLFIEPTKSMSPALEVDVGVDDVIESFHVGEEVQRRHSKAVLEVDVADHSSGLVSNQVVSGKRVPDVAKKEI
jgi:hypothetical protein